MSQPVESAAPAAPAPSAGARPSRGRSVAAVLCLVLAALLTTPAGIAYWGQRTLNDTERYVATVEPLVESAEVQDVIATRVSDALQSQVDIEAILRDVFAGVIDEAPRLDQLVGPLSAAINGLIEREVRAFVASDAFAEFWVRANTTAQQVLLKVLQGTAESTAIGFQGNEIVLDVDEVINVVKERLVARGLTLLEGVPIPETDRQVVLLDAPQVKQLRTIYAFANPPAKWLLPVAALLYLAAFALARRRARMMVWIGACILANALLVALLLSVGRQLFVNQLAGTPFGPASRVFFDTLLAYLQNGRKAMMWLGIVGILAGLYAGAAAWANPIRRGVSGALEGAGAELVRGPAGGPVGQVGTAILPAVGWLRGGAIVLGGVVLLWGNNATAGRLAWSVAFVVLLLAVLQVLVGAGRASHADGPGGRGGPGGEPDAAAA
ncbi:hypothetical protein E8D34_04805 [Nocardioides sp. GY 10113]|uniref:hypothetical protein n=1 Tax=Nocardioides sp. GY 10113 TaxID=2569761 RepID=UPI0010A7FD17|nr:hypothetical protein [Nocardioides sp. GY 10113]TIC88263.1 hypothetical protein E8D34_04805 [Nocardioides sp. GY 10113]